MKEQNLYTHALAAAGVLSILLAVYTLVTNDQRWELLGKVALVSVLVLFSIQIPSKHHYSFDHVALVYVVFKTDWKLAGLVALVSMLSIYIRYNWTKFSIFRLLINVGMCQISIIPFLLPFFYGKQLAFWDILLLFIVLDLISISLNKGIHISMLGRSVLQLPQWNTLKFSILFVTFSSVIGFRVVSTTDLPQLLLEISFLTVVLMLFTYLTSLAHSQLREFEDTRKNIDLGFTAIGYFVIETTAEGAILDASTLGLQALDLSQLDKTDTLLIDSFIHPDSIADFRFAYQMAVKGQAQEAIIRFNTNRLERPSTVYRLQFVPCTRNMRLGGVMMIGHEHCIRH